jgi:hypothetical protein
MTFKLFLSLSLFSVLGLAQPVAPDATADPGGLGVSVAEYKLPPGFDAVVLGTAPVALQTELWATVYRPATGSGPWPLLVFLHGNHATCGRDPGAGQGHFDTSVLYTFTGECPAGYFPVRSDQGYAYLANELAKHGYLVVSINANRGVNAAPGYRTTPVGTPLAPTDDPGLNQRRGRLVLRHLQQLAAWNGGAPTPAGLPSLAGKIDFSHVGMMGHSRGGEGVRAAYNFYTNPALAGAGANWPALIGAVNFQAIFEIGPVDGQTGTIFDAPNAVWNVLLPMCDGDVFNLQGVRPFDRMMISPVVDTKQKSTYTVWGTNHNFYNTEWQVSDSPGCFAQDRLFAHLIFGSDDQRIAARASLLAFFRGNVGAAADPNFNRNFNPQFLPPAVVTNVTRVDRGYTDSPETFVFDDFPAAPTNTYNASNIALNFGGIANHSSQQRVAQIRWNNPGANTFFQSNRGSAVDATAFETLDFRVSRQCGDPACTKQDRFFNFETNFSIALVDDGGDVSSSVQLKDYISLTGPVGSLTSFAGVFPHPILQTVRIPLELFTGASFDATHVRGVRLTFDDTRLDEIFIGNIRFSNVTGLSAPAPALVTSTFLASDSVIADFPSNKNDNNNVKSIKSSRTNSGQSVVEIELTSNREFLPQGELLTLRIGSNEFTTSRYPATGDTNTLIFTLTAAEFAALKQGDNISVQYGSGDGPNSWKFGNLK